MAVKRTCDCCGLDMPPTAPPTRPMINLPHPREGAVMYITPKPDIQGWDVCDACICKAFAKLLSAVQIADILHEKITPPGGDAFAEETKRVMAGTIGHDGRKFLSREPTFEQIRAGKSVLGTSDVFIAAFWRAMYDAG